MSKSNKVNHNVAGGVETSSQQPHEQLSIVGGEKSVESSKTKRKFPSAYDIEQMLPASVNMLHDRENLFKSVDWALSTCIPIDHPELKRDKRSELKYYYKASDRYDSEYRRNLVKDLLKYYVEPIYRRARTINFWETFKMKLEKEQDMSKYPIHLVKEKWMHDFYTVHKEERYKFRGSLDQITQYHQAFNRFFPSYSQYLDREEKRTLTPAVNPVVIPNHMQDAIDMGLGDLTVTVGDVNLMVVETTFETDDGLQTLKDEVNKMEVETVTDQVAVVKLKDENGASTSTIQIFPNAEVPVVIKPPSDKTPVDLGFGSREPFTIEIKAQEAPENIILYKFIPWWVYCLEVALLFLSFYLVYVLMKVLPTDWLFDVEEYLTSLETVEWRLWDDNWFYVNWQYPYRRFVAYFILNPFWWITQFNLNNWIRLFSPFYYFVYAEWPGYFDLLYTRMDVLKGLYGEAAVRAASTVVSTVILKRWVVCVQWWVDLSCYSFYLTCAWLVLFGNKYLTVSDVMLSYKLQARRIVPSYLLTTPFLTMDFTPGNIIHCDPKEDMRPTSLKMCELSEKEYLKQTIHVKTSNINGYSLDHWFAFWTGILNNYFFGSVETERSYQMNILPDLLADVMDIKALTALRGSEFQSRLMQVMSSSAHFNFDKSRMLEYENLAMNTLIYGMALKKLDETKQLGNFPAGLWTVPPAQLQS